MGMGWHEWPLMIFTVLGQCVVGGFIVLALALISGRLDNDRTRRVHLSMFFLWVLMGIGFIASVMHLGSPMRAFNSLNRIGESALSNEIASGSVFFAVGGIFVVFLRWTDFFCSICLIFHCFQAKKLEKSEKS